MFSATVHSAAMAFHRFQTDLPVPLWCGRKSDAARNAGRQPNVLQLWNYGFRMPEGFSAVSMVRSTTGAKFCFA